MEDHIERIKMLILALKVECLENEAIEKFYEKIEFKLKNNLEFLS